MKLWLLEIEKLGGAGFFIDDSKAWLGGFESFGEFTRLSNSPGTRGAESYPLNLIRLLRCPSLLRGVPQLTPIFRLAP